jgi:ATP-dependent Zn protease
MDGLGTEQIGRSFLENATKIGVLLQHEYADRRRRRIMQNALKRMAWQESRKLEFTDLLNFAVYGTCEVDTLSDTDNTKLRHCVHEAGHALITHIDSREKRPPVYCSVLKRDGIQGIVVPPYDGHERISEDLSYCDIEHKIRASLGGRAAEHLLLGANEASANGSSADVQSATQLASSLFRHWGHAPDISTDQHASSNLAVLGEALNINESARIEAMIREFLQKQFLVALQMLRHHRPYLEKIVATLMEKNVLFEDDFHALVQASDLTI